MLKPGELRLIPLRSISKSIAPGHQMSAGLPSGAETILSGHQGRVFGSGRLGGREDINREEMSRWISRMRFSALSWSRVISRKRLSSTDKELAVGVQVEKDVVVASA